MKYLIHTCTKREWYVNDHLIPLLTEQGITKNDIKVWNDKNKAGNLESFVASCEWIGKNYDLKRIHMAFTGRHRCKQTFCRRSRKTILRV